MAVEGRGQKQKEVAEFFRVEPTTINKALKQLRKRWEEKPQDEKNFMQWVKNL